MIKLQVDKIEKRKEPKHQKDETAGDQILQSYEYDEEVIGQ